MDIINPYEKIYFAKSILKGIMFYYEQLDKINKSIYLEKNFPIKRKDVLVAINFLNAIPEDDMLNNFSQSHPQLQSAMERIDFYSNLSVAELSYNEMHIIIYLDHLLFSAINIMFFKVKIEIPKAIKDLSIDEKIKYLIENKYYYLQNESSFATMFISQAVAYCDSEIEKFKELRASVEINPITAEINKMVEQYLFLVQDNIQGNQLISPLIEQKFPEFIAKLKRMLLIPSFFDITEADKERTFHVFVLGVLQGRIEGYNISSNKESGVGRYDIALTPIELKNPGVLIEIKKREKDKANIENELDEALNQIEKKLYFTEMRNIGVQTILNVAIVFEGLEPHIKYNKFIHH